MNDIAAICATAAAGVPDFAWLDGGDGPGQRGVVAAFADREVRGESLSLLDQVQQDLGQHPEARWIGWLSYGLGATETLGRPVQRGALPGLCLRRYPGVLEVRQGRCVAERGDASALRVAMQSAAGAMPDITARDQPNPWPTAWPLGPLTAQVAPAEHRRRIAAAQTRIAAGDTYQVNLSQPFAAPWTDPWRLHPAARRAAALYAQLRLAFPATMGGLLHTDVGTIVSNSPETLLRTTVGAGQGGGVLAQSWPIKGTRPRQDDPTLDAAEIDALVRSEKDAAEHVMIVDLVRNDLGRLARPATVQARPTPTVLSLPTVHHLVTEVRATLRDDVGLSEMISALFPGGSITGAPKRSTVEIIDGLEQHARGIYCGSLVLIEPSGITLSIAIRTALADDAGVSLCSGGGIVIDSDPEAERVETLDKAAAFFGPRSA